MVYYAKTFELLHELTEEGEKAYQKMLEFAADELLFKHKHPIKYWLQRIRNKWLYGDSAWLGPEYPEQEKFKDGFSYTCQEKAE